MASPAPDPLLFSGMELREHLRPEPHSPAAVTAMADGPRRADIQHAPTFRRRRR